MEIRDAPKLKNVIRLDSMPINKAQYTPEGYLKDRPILTTCGIFEYHNNDGSIRRELRLPEEVFAPESLKSYRGAPIIITHDAGLIDKENVAENQIGTILSNGERSGDNVVADIIIHDTDTMKDAGLKELSLGYNLDLEETAGEWHGQHYDAIQRNITINHLALVREARAGESARLNLDSRDSKNDANVLKGGKLMSKKIRRTRHADDVLSPEEFEKAIDEYKQRKAQREQTDAEDEVMEEEIEVKPEEETVEDKVEAVKARRDVRDEKGDPKDEEEALGVIARQDEDLDILFDIIDTLLAKQDFKGDEEEVVEEEEEEFDENAPVGGIDDMDKLKADADEELEEEEVVEEEVPEDEEMDEDEEPVEEVEEEEEMVEDGDDVIEEEEDLKLEEDGCDDEEKKLNTDSVDAMVGRSVRNHMIMGNIGRQVGIKGLEYKPVREAKKAIIHKVRPEMRLDGRSDSYINSAFDMARAEIKARNKKDTSYQKKQMFNRDSRDVADKSSAMSARQRMIERQHKK